MKKNKGSSSFLSLLSEIRFLGELIGFWKERKKLKKISTQGVTTPVMVLPGFLTSDIYTLPLRRFLKQKGIYCCGWGLGLNTGYHPHVLKELQKKVDAIYKEHQKPVTLIGWSMGGIYARELGLNHPQKIKKIITLGSPFYLPQKTSIDLLYRKVARHHFQELKTLIAEHGKTEFPIPIIAICAQKDGIVPLHSCFVENHEKIKCYVFKGTHLGLPYNTSVVKRILEELPRD